jgi:hypothetical protein
VKEQFKEINFHAKTLRMINHANAIIADMKAQGYTLTLRQLYYRMVESKLLENKQTNYDRLGYIVDEARKCGLIDWDAIEDRTRFLRRIANYRGPSHFLSRMMSYYAEDVWRDQEHYCEVWIEKDALIGVVERPCNEYRVPHFACRGYPSSSELYVAAKRLRRQLDAGKLVKVFYLGDHDPSGIDMTRSNEELLQTFARSIGIEVERIGLNMDQVEEYNLVPDPAKQTDSRFQAYSEEYNTDESWELDALTPSVIDGLIRTAIESVVDQNDFDAKLAQEADNKELLQKISDNVPGVNRYLKYRDEQIDGLSEDGTYSADDLLQMAEEIRKPNNVLFTR